MRGDFDRFRYELSQAPVSQHLPQASYVGGTSLGLSEISTIPQRSFDVRSGDIHAPPSPRLQSQMGSSNTVNSSTYTPQFDRMKQQVNTQVSQLEMQLPYSHNNYTYEHSTKYQNNQNHNYPGTAQYSFDGLSASDPLYKQNLASAFTRANEILNNKFENLPNPHLLPGQLPPQPVSAAPAAITTLGLQPEPTFRDQTAALTASNEVQSILNRYLNLQSNSSITSTTTTINPSVIPQGQLADNTKMYGNSFAEIERKKELIISKPLIEAYTNTSTNNNISDKNYTHNSSKAGVDASKQIQVDQGNLRHIPSIVGGQKQMKEFESYKQYIPLGETWSDAKNIETFNQKMDQHGSKKSQEVVMLQKEEDHEQIKRQKREKIQKNAISIICNHIWVKLTFKGVNILFDYLCGFDVEINTYQRYILRRRNKIQHELLVQFIAHCAITIQKVVRGFVQRRGFKRLLRFKRLLTAILRGWKTRRILRLVSLRRTEVEIRALEDERRVFPDDRDSVDAIDEQLRKLKSSYSNTIRALFLRGRWVQQLSHSSIMQVNPRNNMNPSQQSLQQSSSSNYEQSQFQERNQDFSQKTQQIKSRQIAEKERSISRNRSSNYEGEAVVYNNQENKQDGRRQMNPFVEDPPTIVKNKFNNNRVDSDSNEDNEKMLPVRGQDSSLLRNEDFSLKQTVNVERQNRQQQQRQQQVEEISVREKEGSDEEHESGVVDNADERMKFVSANPWDEVPIGGGGGKRKVRETKWEEYPVSMEVPVASLARVPAVAAAAASVPSLGIKQPMSMQGKKSRNEKSVESRSVSQTRKKTEEDLDEMNGGDSGSAAIKRQNADRLENLKKRTKYDPRKAIEEANKSKAVKKEDSMIPVAGSTGTVAVLPNGLNKTEDRPLNLGGKSPFRDQPAYQNSINLTSEKENSPAVVREKKPFLRGKSGGVKELKRAASRDVSIGGVGQRDPAGFEEETHETSESYGIQNRQGVISSARKKGLTKGNQQAQQAGGGGVISSKQTTSAANINGSSSVLQQQQQMKQQNDVNHGKEGRENKGDEANNSSAQNAQKKDFLKRKPNEVKFQKLNWKNVKTRTNTGREELEQRTIYLQEQKAINQQMQEQQKLLRQQQLQQNHNMNAHARKQPSQQYDFNFDFQLDGLFPKATTATTNVTQASFPQQQPIEQQQQQQYSDNQHFQQQQQQKQLYQQQLPRNQQNPSQQHIRINDNPTQYQFKDQEESNFFEVMHQRQPLYPQQQQQQQQMQFQKDMRSPQNQEIQIQPQTRMNVNSEQDRQYSQSFQQQADYQQVRAAGRAQQQQFATPVHEIIIRPPMFANKASQPELTSQSSRNIPQQFIDLSSFMIPQYNQTQAQEHKVHQQQQQSQQQQLQMQQQQQQQQQQYGQIRQNQHFNLQQQPQPQQQQFLYQQQQTQQVEQQQQQQFNNQSSSIQSDLIKFMNSNGNQDFDRLRQNKRDTNSQQQSFSYSQQEGYNQQLTEMSSGWVKQNLDSSQKQTQSRNGNRSLSGNRNQQPMNYDDRSPSQLQQTTKVQEIMLRKQQQYMNYS